MEYVTENIFEWTGRVERTEEEMERDHEEAVAALEQFIATDPYLRKVREERDRKRALEAKAEAAEA